MSVRNGANRRGRIRGRDLAKQKKIEAIERADAAESAVSVAADAVTLLCYSNKLMFRACFWLYSVSGYIQRIYHVVWRI
jgi:hypothetical protein